MKWGRHRSSSSRLSSLSHVFPTSWLSKFKQMSIKTQPQLAKSKRKTIPKSPSLSSPMPLVFRGNRLYGEDPSFSPEVLDGRMGRSNSRLSEIDGDDAFWRLSFGDESVEGKKIRSMLKSVWFDSDDELDFPSPGYQGCRLTTTEVVEKEEIQFSDMISDTRKIRELPPNVEILPGNETCKGVEGLDETEFETPRRKIVKNGRVSDGKSKKGDQRIVEEQSSVSHRELTKAKQKSTNLVQEVELELEPATMQATKDTNHSLIAPRYISTSNSRDTNADLKEIDRVFVEKSNSEQKTDIDIKIKELLSKRERQRKSPHVNRELQRRKKQTCKVRVYSPRTASKIENCKIRALEDAKNTKMKRKKRDKAVEGRTSLESFAVVKCSFNPQKDFRDSMEEMIAEKRIRQPEELEELLACYLSLNSDEYHDLIIEAFRQVWFELNQDCFSPELEKDHSMYDCSQST